MKNALNLNAKILAFIFLIAILILCLFGFTRTKSNNYSVASTGNSITFNSVDEKSGVDATGHYALIINTSLTHGKNYQNEPLSHLGTISYKFNGKPMADGLYCFFCYDSMIGIYFFTSPIGDVTFDGSFSYENKTYYISRPITLNCDGTNFTKPQAEKLTISFNIDDEIIKEQITYEQYTFKSLKSIANKTILGYRVKDKFYYVGETITVTENLEATAEIIGFYMEKGASVRLSVTNSGLRFKSHLSENDYNKLLKLGVVELGTIIIPTKNIGVKEFKLENFIAGKTILDILTTKQIVEKGEIIYAGVICEIMPQNYNKKFSGRAYIKITKDNKTNYIYSNYNEEDSSRSIYEISKKAVKDTSFNELEEDNKAVLNRFINAVIEINYTNNTVELPKDRANEYVITSSGEIGNRFGITIKLNKDFFISCVTINGTRRLELNGDIGDFQCEKGILGKSYKANEIITITFKK